MVPIAFFFFSNVIAYFNNKELLDDIFSKNSEALTIKIPTSKINTNNPPITTLFFILTLAIFIIKLKIKVFLNIYSLMSKTIITKKIDFLFTFQVTSLTRTTTANFYTSKWRTRIPFLYNNQLPNKPRQICILAAPMFHHYPMPWDNALLHNNQ